MATLTEGRHAGEYIVSEANGCRSRERVTIDGEDLGACTVIAKVASTGNYKQLDPSSTTADVDVAAGVLFDAVIATGTTADAVAHVRDCEVNGYDLEWPDGITDNEKATAITELAALGIIVR
ncbi:head decoration protein [Hahella ganghwensis]|uniref:head decoration protein n=1 Tax=Hahella ganghwensis TaxID=286420 RepID=UPI00037908EE|nr:head decoration protein [Hahella ganghwensis]